MNKFKTMVIAIAAALWGLAIVCSLLMSNTAEPSTYASIMKVQVGKGHGTGFVVGDNLVMTAAHVVEDVADPNQVEIWLEDGRVYEPVDIVLDLFSDLAILVFEHDLGLEPLTFADYRPAVGDEVTAIGYPLWLRQYTSFGHVSADYYLYLVVDCHFIPGQSGGPVLDSRGRVLGVVTRTVPGYGIGWAALARDAVWLLEYVTVR